MNAQMVLTMGQEALLMLLMVSAPVLAVVLVVGLVIGLFQAVTQIDCCCRRVCHCRALDAQYAGGIHTTHH